MGFTVPIERVTSLLRSAPGPALWYSSLWPEVHACSQPCRWLSLPGASPSEEWVALCGTLNGVVALAVPLYARVFAPVERCVAVVQPSEERDSEADGLLISVFETEHLLPVQFPQATGSQTRYWHTPPVAAAAPSEVLRLPGGLQVGRHKCAKSTLLQSVPEMLLLGQGPMDSDPECGAFTSIYRWRPEVGTIDVFPQDWFTRRAFDVGYQWITRIARDLDSGRIVGDGIRVPPFILDEFCRKLAGQYSA